MKFQKTKFTLVKKVSIYLLQLPLNDEVDNYGNQGPVVVEQTKEEREAKVAKTYLGNVKVVWTNGDNVAAAPRDGQPQQAAAVPEPDLPF